MTTDLDAEQRELAEGLRASGDMLRSVIEDILDFSKIEAGKLEIHDEVFDVRDVVEGACMLLAPATDEKDVELVCRFDPLAPQRVRGDANRLRQVLLNLLGNAVKFTHEGEIVVHATVERRDAHHQLRVEVRDTGIGIEPAALARIFDAFAQADNSMTRQYGGTGLGLAISRRLLQLMGGEIGVDSTPGQGSTFWFSVTLAGVATDDPEAQAAAMTTMTGHRVLVVDDNETSRRLLHHTLTTWGATCHTAPDALAALASLRTAARAGSAYDLVVLDSRMPRMSGLDLAAMVRADPLLTRTGLLMLTSSGTNRETAARVGVDGLVAKPVRQARLHEEALRIITRPTSPPTPATSPHTTDRPDGRRSTHSLPTAPAGAPPRILVAEDIPVNQVVISRILERHGCIVDVAADGEEALERHACQHYDLIFMDCQMPRLDGYRATAEIRDREGSRRHTPIVAMTAHAMTGDRERCLAAGMDDYVPKPIDPDTIDQILARLLHTP
jgi:CheY-like chemotaxis protein